MTSLRRGASGEPPSLQLSDEAWDRFDRLRATGNHEVMHGSWETLICYRGYRIGGLDREAGHWFFYETLANYTCERWLSDLGFTKERMRRREGTACAGHMWYQVPLESLEKFAHAVGELADAIDSQLARQ